MDINICLDWNACGNNSNSSLPGLENDSDIGRDDVCIVLCILGTSHTVRILSKPMLWLRG